MIPHLPRPELRNLAWFSPALFIGLFLRLHGLSSQILLDDEWHSLNFVLDKSFWTVLTSHGLGANCIPQNTLNWIILHTIGWSEVTLFLPSALCGICGLLIFPWLVSRLAGRSVALYFSYLFALSPCATFYSRIVRPYPMTLFFGFLALLCLALWTRDGRFRFLLAYALSGVIAIYFHIYAALSLLAPLIALWAVAGCPAMSKSPWISRRTFLLTGTLMLFVLLFLLGPAHWKNPWWMRVLGSSRVTAEGLWNYLSLLSGTGNPLSKVIFALFVAFGIWKWMQRDFGIGLVWTAIFSAFCLFVVFASQEGMHAAIQIARYNILLLPTALLLASVALDHLLAHLPSSAARIPLGLMIIAGSLIGNPIWRTHASPNNFMHHSAFQDSYAPFDTSRSRVRALTPLPQMTQQQIPKLYTDLASDPSVPGLIEYPMFIGDAINFHYYPQLFHHKPVSAGYVPDFPLPPLPSGNDVLYQTTMLDYVFSRAQSLGFTPKMRFSHTISITDFERIHQTHPGWILLVHRYVRPASSTNPQVLVSPSPLLGKELEDHLGPPLFSDSQILAWRIP